MAQGLRTANMTIAAGATRKLTLRGVFFYLKETAFPMSVALRQNDIGEKSGLVFENEMRKGEKLYSATEFDKVEIRNDNAVDVTVQFVVGYGDYARELPERVSAADVVTWTRVVIAATGVTEALIPGRDFRKRMIVQNRLASAAAGVFVANTDAELAAGNGEEIGPGQSSVHEHKAALVIRGTIGDVVIVREEIYND